MNVVTAYKWKMTGKDVIVTILDDGIEKDHPDLSRNYVCLDRFVHFLCPSIAPCRQVLGTVE